MEYIPLFVSLKNRSVLVVGGGVVAFRKVCLLKKNGAIIKIVAKNLCTELKKVISINTVIWIGKKFHPSMLSKVFLVIVATNDSDINSMIFHYAEKSCILINTVDNQLKCSFIFPSIINRNPISIGISSGGNSPVLIRMLREKLESLLPLSVGFMARIAGAWRNRVKKHIKNLRCRRYFWEKLFYNSHFSLLVEQGNFKKAHQTIKYLLRKNDSSSNKTGNITLVGAGPGDVGLLTIRGLQVMQQADVILYDRLINTDILDLARRDSNKIYVGKSSGKHMMSQMKLNNFMIRLARQGNHVVRLKGGDSFIFGRGGEELQAISKSGIKFQVVPGITAAIGAAAYAGIPLTHRDYSHGVTFITGHNSNNDQINWSLLSDSFQTVVIYMGYNNIMNISKNLIFYGRHINTPVAIISRGTCSNQKVLIGTLLNLSELIDTVIDQPVLLIIGKVVSLYKQINCFRKYKCKSFMRLI